MSGEPKAISKAGAIIPPEAAPLRTLTVTMTVMCYLACLAIGALIIINRAVDSWTRGLSNEITVQVRNISGADIEADLETARKLLSETQGIRSATILAREDSLKLLEPWIGETDLEDLPVPRLIRATVDETVKPDFAALEERLKQHVPHASLDTHQRWASELTRMAGILTQLSYLVLMLICASAIAMVIFAARAVLDANRNVVHVLHLVGARNGYIARQIDKRFIVAGLWAGLIGVIMGLVTFFVIGTSAPRESNGLAAAANSLLYVPGETLWINYASLLAVPVVAVIIAVVTSRLTLMNMLKILP